MEKIFGNFVALCVCVQTLLFCECAPFSLMQELTPSFFDSTTKKQLQEFEYSAVKDALLQKIEQAAGEEKSRLQVVLATLYMKDQKEEEAFLAYLEALHVLPKKEKIKMAAAENALYTEALQKYLDSAKGPTEEAAAEIESTLCPKVKAHPEYIQARFLLASAYANQKRYEEFFYHFYLAYMQCQDSFLAYKTLAILNIKLFERERSEEAKNSKREEVQKYVQLAISENASDVSLYKLLLAFANDGIKKETVAKVLEQIVQNNVQIPRSDIPYYINEALQVDEKEVAKSFLNKQATYYQYSRIIEDMRKVITDDKNGNS